MLILLNVVVMGMYTFTPPDTRILVRKRSDPQIHAQHLHTACHTALPVVHTRSASSRPPHALLTSS